MTRCASLLLAWVLAAPLAHAAAGPADAGDPVAAAMAQARERRAPVLVDFTAPWCYSCYYMAKNVLTGPEWDKAGRDAVVVELDADSPVGARYMKEWRVKAMPTYLLFDAEGRELGRILGEQSRTDFYGWLGATLARSPLEALKAKATDGAPASLAAAREVLRAYHARYDAQGGLAWAQERPAPLQEALGRDAQAAGWLARLELQRAAADKDGAACASVAPKVLALDLGCERSYELDKVLACTQGQPDAVRRPLLQGQIMPMKQLVEQRVLKPGQRCADERSAVGTTADLHEALGDAAARKDVLDRAIADVTARVGGDAGLKKDRNLADNLRVYLEAAGRIDELHRLLPKLIAAYPEDYVYAYRYAKSLAARGQHAEAVPYYEQAAAKAYGVNKLRNAELHAKSLQALKRDAEARQVLAGALKAAGPWFPDDAARAQALLRQLQAAAR